MYFKICILLLILLSNTQQAPRNDRILKTDIKSLTFSAAEFTTGRRKQPIPQLNCQSGCSLAQPNSITCENKGYDGNKNTNWDCKTLLPNAVKFGKMVVNCEGYDSASDDYVLIGSCGLEYNLENINEQTTTSISQIISSIIVIVILVWFLITLIFQIRNCILGRETPLSRGNRFGIGHGGGGMGGMGMASGFASSSAR